MSIKDYSKEYIIQNATTGQIENKLQHKFFTEYGNVQIQASVGDIILINKIKEILFNGHDLHITTGYMSESSYNKN